MASLRKKPANTKLTDPGLEFLIEQLAQFASHQQAADRLATSELGIKIDRSRVTRIAKDHARQIKEAREAYLSTFDETPLAHTKLRVLEYQRLFREARDNAMRIATGEAVSLRLSLTDQIELQAKMLDGIRQEMNPIQHALIIGAGAKEAELFLQALGFGPGHTRAIPEDKGPPRTN